MGREQVLLQLVGMAYGAAADTAQWPAFLEGFAEATRARAGFLHLAATSPCRTQVVCAFGMEAPDVRAYNSHYAALDPWARPELMRAGLHGASHTIVNDQALERLEFYQDFMRPRRLHYGMAAVVACDAGRASLLSVLREKERGPCDVEVETLGLLLPHLQRARLLQDRLAHLGAERRALLDRLDGLRDGCILLNSRGEVVLTNRAAERMLRENDGLRLDRRTLVAARPAETNLLHTAVREMLALTLWQSPAQGGSLRLQRPSQRLPYSILIVPVPSRDEWARDSVQDQPSVMVVVRDPEEGDAPDSSLLARLFAFTPTEARLAALLAQGNTLAVAAARMGVSYETVRTHLRRLFQKTQTRRQPDLMRLLVGAGRE